MSDERVPTPSSAERADGEAEASPSELERTPRRSRRGGGSDGAPIKKERPDPASPPTAKAENDGGAPEDGVHDEEDDGGEGGDEGVTRCVCGSTDENLGLMIQCETCKCWQHCSCMGMHSEDDCPDVYYCEQCRPENHVALLRSLGFLGGAKAARRGGGRAARGGSGGVSKAELREARDAIRVFAEENAARLLGSDAAAAVSERRGAAPSRASSSEPRLTPKRRTMNSRDIGEDGWEQIPPELLVGEQGEAPAAQDALEAPADAPAAEAAPSEAGAEDPDLASRKRKRSAETAPRPSEEAPPPPAEGKRRRVQDNARERRTEADDVPEPPPAADRARKDKAAAARDDKPRHANQYTYRRQETPASALPPRARDARRGARETGSRGGTPLPEGGARGAGNVLPEHLAHLAHLVPPASGPGGAARAAEPAPDASPASPSLGGPAPWPLVVPVDAATKIRYPQKRMTLGEMRKRVRTISEYVTRVQIEAVARTKRQQCLAALVAAEHGAEDADGAGAKDVDGAGAEAGTDGDAPATEATSAAEPAPDADDAPGADDATGADDAPGADDATGADDASGADAAPDADAAPLPSGMQLAEQLTRDIHHFVTQFGWHGSAPRGDDAASVGA